MRGINKKKGHISYNTSTVRKKGIKKIPGDYLEDKSYIIVIGLEQKLIGLKKLLKVLL